VGSPSWRVSCASVVNDFRKTLSPEEAELFNECLIRICHDPQVDKIHKFRLKVRLPLIDYLYQDDNFVIVYYWTQTTNPITMYNITIFQAARTSDFDQGNIVPRR
jgi:hypothetical protein